MLTVLQRLEVSTHLFSLLSVQELVRPFLQKLLLDTGRSADLGLVHLQLVLQIVVLVLQKRILRSHLFQLPLERLQLVSAVAVHQKNVLHLVRKHLLVHPLQLYL